MSDIPAEDIDYAVENALWVARASITARTSTAIEYLDVFERQLVVHWAELEKVHADVPETTDATTQTVLVPDGGQR